MALIDYDLSESRTPWEKSDADYNLLGEVSSVSEFVGSNENTSDAFLVDDLTNSTKLLQLSEEIDAKLSNDLRNTIDHCSHEPDTLQLVTYSSSTCANDFTAFMILELPNEIQFKIILAMTLKDVAMLSRCSSHFHSMFCESRHWRLRSKSDWSLIHSRLLKTQYINWESYYRMKRCMKLSNFISDNTVSITEAATTSNSQISLSGFSFPQMPFGLYGFTGCAYKNKIYFIGGQQTSSVRTDAIHVYDTTSQTFSRLQLSFGVVPIFARHVAAAVNGIIYVFGGYNGVDTFYELAKLNIKKKTWDYPKTTLDDDKNTHAFPPLRSNGACATVDKCLYVFGGSNNDDLGQYQIVEDFSVLDLTTMHWTTLENQKKKICKVSGVPTPGRVGHRMVSVGTKLYMYGGGVWVTGRGWTQRFRGLHVFDTITREWSVISPHENMPDISYPFVFVVQHQIFITQLHDPQLYVFDTLTQRWSELRVAGVLPEESRTMGAVAVVDSSAYFLGSFHLTEVLSASYCDFHRMSFSNVK